jgi:hypothetical protein
MFNSLLYGGNSKKYILGLNKDEGTILVMEADPAQLAILKQELRYISSSTGLTIIFHKSCMLTINISEEQVKALADDFGCLVRSFPFT